MCRLYQTSVNACNDCVALQSEAVKMNSDRERDRRELAFVEWLIESIFRKTMQSILVLDVPAQVDQARADSTILASLLFSSVTISN
jgi:hypothetical protein